jgi:hypothetical protein
MHKSATKCNETVGKWCKNRHGASKIIDMLETYQASVVFSFVCCNKWLDPQQISFGEVALLFICQEHSVFHSYRFNECSLFSATAFSFYFSP